MTEAKSYYWVLVADSGYARIFTLRKEPAEFVEVQELISDSRHQTNRDLVSDASGRIANVKGGPSSHTMQPRSDPHDQAEQALQNELSGDGLDALKWRLAEQLPRVAAHGCPVSGSQSSTR